ncbi:MAG: RagB/SusD family nutrient uptake outer membrane protein [Bacteroidales bacterium]|nr:RagB/SusD family nutrient uptake outer membrane protein [Bacteroidales bacterium]
MKNKILILLTIGFLSFSCNKMDLNPLSEGSSESWYSNDNEIRMSLDYLYTLRFWNPNPDPLNFDNCAWLDVFSDDWTNRTNVGAITAGTINGQSTVVTSWWTYYYQCIAAANLVLEKLDNAKSVISEGKMNQYIAEARFVRAAQYSKLIFYYGDVPYTDKTLKIADAFQMGRISKADVLKKIYDDFDFAASTLPLSYSGTKYATKGAALALKARIALYMGDYTVARDAAKACMDLNVNQLYPDFSTLFLSKTKNSVESVFAIPRSVSLNVYSAKGVTQQPLSRNSSGNDYVQPSWDLFCSFLCKDGLPIDESPLYNPQKPFQNRDPRCAATIVEFGTEFCGFIYEPHPDSLKTTKVATGTRVSNLDCRAVTQYASYNGLAWRKGIDSDWWDDFMTDPDNTVIRYADVLLIYAEARIELNQIDQSVLDAINKVRARAYKVDFTQTASYPAVTSTDQTALRKILRMERRMEFAFEGLRHADIIRWRLAEKVLNTKIYGMIDPPEQREKIVKPGLWFFPEVVPIDEDGIPDFTSMYNHGFCKILAVRSFDKSKHYLWPIPTKEILINKNLTQNPGY